MLSLAKGRKEGETLIWGAELNHEGLEIGGATPAGGMTQSHGEGPSKCWDCFVGAKG